MAERANNRKRTTRSVFIALFAAIIGVSGFVAIPAGPAGVPIVLQNMMVLLAGTVLGGFQGAAAVGLYILGGVLGLPVFAGGRSGLASLASPSGGFIVGYFIGAAAAGIFLQAPSVEEQRVTARQSFRVALAS
ncbi:MAG: biotin transporter BioY, partial [Spirochaetaceae bacterium]|nr:biotin transporter BioY [Spirochaetaceae bacterium]